MASTKAKTDQTSKKGKVQKKEEDKSKKVLKEDSKKQDNVPVPTEVSTMKQQDEQQPKEESTEEEVSNPVSVYVNKLNNYVDRISAMNKELKEMVSPWREISIIL